MKAFKKSIEELLKELKVHKNKGLTEKQIIENKKLYGENFFIKNKNKTFFKIIYDNSKDPIIFFLFISFFITLLINLCKFINNKEIEFLESIGIFIAIFISISISSILEYKSLKYFEKLNQKADNFKVKVIRNGKINLIYQSEIVVGDIVELSAGEKIPADGRIIEENNLSIDESTITGENNFVIKNADIVFEKDVHLAERINMLYAGCFVRTGFVKIIITEVGSKTELGLILNELVKNSKSFTPMQKKLFDLAKTITTIGVFISFLIFLFQIYTYILNDKLKLYIFGKIFIDSIVFLVAVIPEGLTTTITIVLAINIIKMYKEKALIKKLFSLETMGFVNVICSDKTGTLTENKMKIKKIFVNNIFYNIFNFKNIKNIKLIENMIINNNAYIVFNNKKLKFIGSPTECSILKMFILSFKKKGFDLYKYIKNKNKIKDVFSFSSQNKNMTTIIEEKNNLISFSKGSSEKILSQCKYFYSSKKIDLINEYKLLEINNFINKYEKKGKRILAFAHKIFKKKDNIKTNCRKFFEKDMIFDGFVVIEDPIKKNVYKSFQSCKRAGIEIKILTGDSIVTAKSIAKKLNLLDKYSIFLEGKEIDIMSDEELKKIIYKIKIIARSTPFIKLRIVKILKSLGNIVAVTGDGINDALAIKNANVGISMGISGAEVSKEASDIVLLDDNFSTIIKAIKLGRSVYENFQRFIQFQLTVNFSASMVILFSLIFGLNMPFTALQILWINFIMDGPPAITLGIEPVKDSIMERKSLNKNSNIITKRMLNNIICNGLFISFFCMLQYFFNIINCKNEEKTTVLFTLFVLLQLLNIFNSKELNNSSLFLYLFENKFIILISFISIILQILIVQYGGFFFNTVPLSIFIWIKILIISFSIIFFSELIKFFDCFQKNILK